MRWRTPAFILLLASATSCGDGSTSPDPPPPPPGANYAIFTDPTTGFNTTDVRDVDDEVVRIDLDEGALIWLPDSLAFDGWTVNGNFLNGGQFEVRFGRDNGQQRAYFTEVGPGTLCDLEVNDGFLSIQPTNQLPPR